jgi:hypothetical protein
MGIGWTGKEAWITAALLENIREGRQFPPADLEAPTQPTNL